MRVLVTLPNSIAGTLILNGFADGFKNNDTEVFVKDLRELTKNDIQNFAPDVIFGYDYGFLFYDNEKLNNYILQNLPKFKIIHYFADSPDNNFALVNNTVLYEKYLEYSKNQNVITYIWDKDLINKIPNSKYLPLGVNTSLYTNPPAKNYKYEISFVGRPLTNRREHVLSEIIKQFPHKLNIFCYKAHFEKSVDEIKNQKLLNEYELEIYKNSYRGFLKSEQELSKVYNISKINLNITLQGESNLNYRVFEVPASNGFLLTDFMEDVPNHFEIGYDLDVYTETTDLINKIEFYLKNDILRQKIAQEGCKTVIKKHSYNFRVQEILKNIL